MAGVLTAVNAQNNKASSSTSPTEGFFMRNGFLMSASGGTVRQMPTDQVLANGTTLSIYGKITQLNGSISAIAPGELFNFDGTKTGKKIEDYATVKNGRAVVITNEIAAPVTEGFKTSGSVIVNSDGTTNSGVRITEGKKMDMKGKMIEAAGSGN